MAIEVFPSLMQGAPIETHEAGNMTLGEWLGSKGIDYAAHETQPIQIAVNGSVIEPARWAEYRFTSSDRVEIRIVPQGGVFNALGSIIGKVFNAVFGWMMPKTRSPGTRNTPSGERLDASNATANQARLGEAVPEQAGLYRRFPDYLTPPRRFFVNKREQHVTFMCCVGVGHYQIDTSTIKIGDTPFDTLGSAAQYTLFPPGADVSGNWAHDNWYSVEEVGGTSSGTAGLELSVEPSSDVNPTAPAYALDNDWIATVGGTWPDGWAPGTIFSMPIYRSYVITSEATETGSWLKISGNFRELALQNGLNIRMREEGGSAVNRQVQSFDVDSNGAGWIRLTVETGLSTGTKSIWFYRTIMEGYRVTAIPSATQIVVQAVDGDGDPIPWGGFESFSGPFSITVKQATIYGAWTGPFRVCPEGERVSTFELDFFFPQGLCYIDDGGGLQERSVSVQVRYRGALEPEEDWTTITYTYTERTMDQIGFTERITLGVGTVPEVQVRRVGARETSTQVNDTVQWYGLRSMLPTAGVYPNWTTMAVRLSSGGKLGANSENKINLIATRVLPELLPDGTWSAPTSTRHISAFFRYVLTTIGYTDSHIDMDELRRLNDTWNARGDTFNHVFDETTVKEAIDTVLIAGMSEMTVEDGRIRPVRDEPRTVFEQAYSAQNMTGPLRRAFRARRVDDVDGVEVEFTDVDTWTKTTVKCLIEGDAGAKLEKLSLKGAFDRTRAWRIGMRRRRVLRFRNWDYSFSTEMDALNSRYLSFVPLIDESSDYSQSAILTNIQAVDGQALLRVSEPLNWHEGQTHVVAYRDPEGKLVGPFPAAPGPDEYSVFADMPEPYPIVTLKHEPPHVYFGTSERWSFPALITSVTPQGMESVNVSAENYHPAVYDDDNASPPA